MKVIFSFGSAHLPWIKGDPSKVMLVVEALDEEAARRTVMNTRIGRNFSTTYPYSEAKRLKRDYGWEERTLDEVLGGEL